MGRITLTNFKTIVEQIALVELQNPAELQLVVRIIYRTALASPHFLETYADMVFELCSLLPEFFEANDGETPVTFRRLLINACQEEFENLPVAFEATEED